MLTSRVFHLFLQKADSSDDLAILSKQANVLKELIELPVDRYQANTQFQKHGVKLVSDTRALLGVCKLHVLNAEVPLQEEKCSGEALTSLYVICEAALPSWEVYAMHLCCTSAVTLR